MAECNDMSQKNDNSNGYRPPIAKENIQNDLHCNFETNLPENEKCSDQGNSSIKHEEISEFKEVFKKNSVNGEETPRVLGESNNQNNRILTETENVADKEDIRLIKEKLKLLELTTELQDLIINLLQHILKLLDIKSRKFKNDLICSVEVLKKALDGAVEKYLKQSGVQNSELQNILDVIESTNTELEKDFVDNMEQILEETHSKFLKFQESYKICKIYLETFHRKSENILCIRNVPNKSEMKQSSLFLILKDLALKLNNSRLALVENDFGEFEKILQIYSKTTAENIDKVDLLLTAFAKANFAYRKLYLLINAVLNIDFAEV